jgi:lipoic acid synthetase
MAAAMRLRHVVITSVTRDDLQDGGARHFAETIRATRETLPASRVEALTPDFGGDPRALILLLDAGPHVFNHNIETVRRLYPLVRPQAVYERSLEVLRFASRYGRGVVVKSGFMVGLGEEAGEVEQLLSDLREAGVVMVTIGQYLQPLLGCLPVASFVPPQQFEAWRARGLEMGFRAVMSGPFVRSSYMAGSMIDEAPEQPC